jgi:hypothetical protein
VVYTSSGGYTEFANEDIRRIGNALLATRTGTAQLNKLADAEHNITFAISRETRVSTSIDGSKSYELGKTTTRRIVGSETFKIKSVESSDIVIYEGSIKKFLEETVNSENLLAKSYQANISTIDQAIGAVAGHESVHAVDLMNHQQSVENQYLGANHDLEAHPLLVESQILHETGFNNVSPIPLSGYSGPY